MYYTVYSFSETKVFLNDNPTGKIVGWNYGSNDPMKFILFVPKVLDVKI